MFFAFFRVCRAQPLGYVWPSHPQTGMKIRGHTSGTLMHLPAALDAPQCPGDGSHHRPLSQVIPIAPPHDWPIPAASAVRVLPNAITEHSEPDNRLLRSIRLGRDRHGFMACLPIWLRQPCCVAHCLNSVRRAPAKQWGETPISSAFSGSQPSKRGREAVSDGMMAAWRCPKSEVNHEYRDRHFSTVY